MLEHGTRVLVNNWGGNDDPNPNGHEGVLLEPRDDADLLAMMVLGCYRVHIPDVATPGEEPGSAWDHVWPMLPSEFTVIDNSDSSE